MSSLEERSRHGIERIECVEMMMMRAAAAGGGGGSYCGRTLTQSQTQHYTDSLPLTTNRTYLSLKETKGT
jgi:hypothetical protein